MAYRHFQSSSEASLCLTYPICYYKRQTVISYRPFSSHWASVHISVGIYTNLFVFLNVLHIPMHAAQIL